MAKHDTDQAEQALLRDLQALEERTRDGDFAGDLYRALANQTWRRADDGDVRVSLSWKRAEAVVNELRERAGRDALTLAQTGGEGEVSPLVGEAIEELGWRSKPLDTSASDPDHVEDAPSAPPPDQGERQAPTAPPEAWLRADEEAEENR